MGISVNSWSEENLPRSGNSGEQIMFCLRQQTHPIGTSRAPLSIFGLPPSRSFSLSLLLCHSLGLSVPELYPLYYAALLPLSL